MTPEASLAAFFDSEPRRWFPFAGIVAATGIAPGRLRPMLDELVKTRGVRRIKGRNSTRFYYHRRLHVPLSVGRSKNDTFDVMIERGGWIRFWEVNDAAWRGAVPLVAPIYA